MIKSLSLFILLLGQLLLSAEVSAPFNLSLKQQGFLKQLPKDFTYGWLEVPENYAKPEGKKIHVFYYGTKPEIKNSIPIVIFNGGPGDGTHGYFMALRNRLKDFNFVFIDQRGAGLSTSYPDVSIENIVRYKHYLSSAIVRDAERIRQHLYKGQKWVIAGHSFGSIVVHRYLAISPQTIHSAHAHGWALSSDATEYPKMRLLAHQKALNEYLKLYPEDKVLIERIRDSFDENDFITDGEFKIRGRAIFDYMGLFTFGMKNSWAPFHSYLHSAYVVDGKVKKSAVMNFATFMLINYAGIGTKQSLTNIVFNRLEGYECGDKSLTQAYEEILAELKKVGNDPYQWPVGEEALGHFGLDHPVLKKADSINLGSFETLKMKKVLQGLHSQKALRLYLYSSEHDAFSPPKMFKAFVNKGSSQVEYKNFLNSGHEGFLSEALIWQKLKKLTRLKVLELAP